MRINRIEIQDLQSWKGGEVIDLSPFGLTVLKGPSETGKSTLTRFLMRFCTSEMDTASMFKAYVRRGCELGGIVFSDTATGEYLQLLLNSNGKFLVYKAPEKEDFDFYSEDEINETVLERFGLIVDDVNGMVINVFSRDNPFLGVATTQLVNGAVLDRVLIGRDVERLIDYLKQQEVELSTFIKDNGIKRTFYKNILNNGRYIDTTILTNYLNLSRRVATLSFTLSSVENDVGVIKTNVLKENKTPPPCTSQELRNLSRFLEMCQRMQAEGAHIQRCDVDVSSITKKLMYLQHLKQLLHCISTMQSECTSIKSKILPEQPPITAFDAANILSLVTFLNNLQVTANTVITNSHKQDTLQTELTLAQSELKTLKEELHVCPLCGSDFGGDK